MKNLAELSTNELLKYKTEIDQKIAENSKEYDNRYGKSPSSYGDSINDEFNGENKAYLELMSLRSNIETEIEKRNI